MAGIGCFDSMDESDSDGNSSSEGWPDGTKQCDSEQSSLIPGLPNDISFTCLARIPRQYHSVLKCVCARWRDMICCEEWYSYRKEHNLEEAWVYVLGKDKFDQLCCYMLDPSQPSKGWKRIPGIPSCCMKRKGMGFEVLGKRLFLFGGHGWFEDATDEVYCYDANMNCWSQAARLSVARCNFACQAVNGTIFAIGGLGPKSSNPQSWDAYNPQLNRWNSHADPNFLRDVEDSVVLNGKIFVRCGSSLVSSHAYVIAYDPSNGTWELADPNMVTGWQGPTAVVDGDLYVLNQNSRNQMMKWQNDANRWVSVGRLASKATRPPCQLVAMRKNILIVGKGLCTTVFSTENGREILTLSSPVWSSSDIEVISCRSVAT